MATLHTLRVLLRDRAIAGLLLGSLGVHALLAMSLHLSPDETQYTLYSAHIDWSYFDHPPLVGWLQWPWNMLGGFDWLMRVVPLVSWGLGAVGVMLLTHTLYPAVPSAARIALLLWSLSPVPHLLGIALVPDTLLMPITCFVMAVCWRLCDAAQVHRVGLWLVLGLGLGLAGLSKYTAVLVGVGAVLALLLAHGVRWLAWRGPWLAAAVAAVLISPVLVWNATHEWISFAYQLGHAAGSADWLPRRVAAYALVQGVGYGVLLGVGVWVAWRAEDSSLSRASAAGTLSTSNPMPPAASLSPGALSAWILCACFGLPSLMLLLYLSGRGSTLPHWSAAAWIALVPAAAAGCQALWARRGNARRALLGWGVFQAICCVGMVVLMLSGGVASEGPSESGNQATSLPGQVPASAQFNPFADLYGWDAAAAQGAAVARQHQVTTLAVMNWTLASRIAWYARPAPVKVVQRHVNQFGLWWGTLQPGESVLLLDWSQMSFAPPVGPTQFERCELKAQQPVMRWGRQIAHFNFLLCRNWQAAPESPFGKRP